LPSLTIPAYQRPYKWSPKNAIQLLQDVQAHKDKSVYRLGTVVVHKEKHILNIVDGQQRTITLLLASHALLAIHQQKPFEHNGLLSTIAELQRYSFKPKFTNHISFSNIQINYREIERFVARMTDEELFY